METNVAVADGMIRHSFDGVIGRVEFSGRWYFWIRPGTRWYKVRQLINRNGERGSGRHRVHRPEMVGVGRKWAEGSKTRLLDLEGKEKTSVGVL
jgi:hypothetical protein